MAGVTLSKIIGSRAQNSNFRLASTAAETALWAQIKGLAASRQGFLWKAGTHLKNGNSDFVRGGLRGDAPTGFLTRDIFGRKWDARIINTSNRTQDRHPILVTQVKNNVPAVILDRPALMVGMSPDLWLTNALNGGLLPDASTDDDVFVPGGYVAIWEILIMPSGAQVTTTFGDGTITTWNVPAYGSNYRWYVMGARADLTSSGECFQMYYDNSGVLTLNNQFGTGLWNSAIYAADHRDGVRHLQMFVFDTTAHTVKLYQYASGVETLLATATSVVVDISTAAPENAKARMLDVGKETRVLGTGVNTNSGSFMSVCGFLQGSTMGSTAPLRQLLWNWALED